MFNSLLDASPCPIPFSEQVTEITFGLNTSTGFASLKKVTLHVRLTLADIPLQLLLPVWVVKDLSEQFTIGLPTLRQYGLLSYMEDPEAWRLSRVAISPEELAEDELHRDEIQFSPPSNDPTPSIPIDDTLLQLGPSFTLVPELLSIISEYHYQFAPLTVSDHLKVPPMRRELRDNARLRHQPARRTSVELNNHIKSEVQRLLDIGFIRPSFSEITSPVVPVLQHGKFRLCNDYRELNLFTVPIRHPIPLIDLCLDRLKDKKWKSSSI
jgi:hypothetical protein